MFLFYNVNRVYCRSTLSLPLESLSRSNKPLDVIHSNVFIVPNFGKFKYYVLFINDYSRMTGLYLLYDKSRVFSKFLALKHIKIFRFDNAFEYTSSQFKHFSLIMALCIIPLIPYSTTEWCCQT